MKLMSKQKPTIKLSPNQVKIIWNERQRRCEYTAQNHGQTKKPLYRNEEDKMKWNERTIGNMNASRLTANYTLKNHRRIRRTAFLSLVFRISFFSTFFFSFVHFTVYSFALTPRPLLDRVWACIDFLPFTLRRWTIHMFILIASSSQEV